MDKRNKKSNWLGPFYKSCIFDPSTLGGELKRRMQLKEKGLRAGGREDYPIKIIETAGRPLERALVNSDPCNGNQCFDKKCLIQSNPNNKINCRRNSVWYKITCKICLKDGKLENKSSSYFGETGQNMHCRSKEHISEFNSKVQASREESSFYKHMESVHGGVKPNRTFGDLFVMKILEAYMKPFTRNAKEGTYIANHNGEVLNSKSEWHQTRIVRTKTTIVQGGADQFLEARGVGGQDRRPGRSTGGGGERS